MEERAKESVLYGCDTEIKRLVHDIERDRWELAIVRSKEKDERDKL